MKFPALILFTLASSSVMAFPVPDTLAPDFETQAVKHSPNQRI